MEEQPCSLFHGKYFRYGTNLIGATHGDGVKQNDLPLSMAEESTENWAKTKHRHIYTHHVHHKTSKDIGYQKQVVCRLLNIKNYLMLFQKNLIEKSQ